MRKSIDSCAIYWEDHKVNPAATIPPDAQLVELRRVQRNLSHNHGAARASTDPPPSPPREGGHDLRHLSRVIDADVVYIDIPTNIGQCRARLRWEI